MRKRQPPYSPPWPRCAPVSKRRIALLALIGLIPVLIALWVAGFDVFQQLGRYALADGTLVGEVAVSSAPYDGKVVGVQATVGQAVRAGQTLASLQRPGSDAPVVVPAPRDGIVVQMGIVEGQDVRAGDTLATLDVSTRLHVVALVDETDISSIRAGQKVEIWVRALDTTYSGTVREVLPPGAVGQGLPSATPTPAASGPPSRAQLPVSIDLDYGDAPLKLGMSVSVRVFK